MKIRSDFVTNSSSSSFICCFARIADPIKAQDILEKHKDRIEVYTSEEILENIKNDRWGRWLEADWAGVDVTPKEDYIKEHAGDQFVVSEIGRISTRTRTATRTTMLTTLISTLPQLMISQRKTVSQKSIASGEPAETVKEGL